MTRERIDELRRELEAERISYGELYEIQVAAEAAGLDAEQMAGDLLDSLEQTV